MKGTLIIVVNFLFIGFTRAQHVTSVQRIYSTFVKDSFEIYITTTPDRGSGKYDEVIYYLDANLRSGKLFRQAAEDDRIFFKKAFVYVGIGHIGNFHQLRRRDFILPFIRNGDTIPKSTDYGQIEHFYQFLRFELIPFIDSRYPSVGRRSILGHSLGGLFAVYCLFRNEGLFNEHFALSPALWIDDYRIFSFNKISDTLAKHSYLFLAAGSKEKHNQILAGFHRLEKFIDQKKYRNLGFDWHIYHGSHNSYIKKDMQRILYEVLHR